MPGSPGSLEGVLRRPGGGAGTEVQVGVEGRAEDIQVGGSKEGQERYPGRRDGMSNGMGTCQPVRACFAATSREQQLEACGGRRDNGGSTCCKQALFTISQNPPAARGSSLHSHFTDERAESLKPHSSSVAEQRPKLRSASLSSLPS